MNAIRCNGPSFTVLISLKSGESRSTLLYLDTFSALIIGKFTASKDEIRTVKEDWSLEKFH